MALISAIQRIYMSCRVQFIASAEEKRGTEETGGRRDAEKRNESRTAGDIEG